MVAMAAWQESVATLARSGLDVFAHNVETVERLTPRVRDRRAGYHQTMDVLRAAKAANPGLVTKSSIMLGLGETDEAVVEAALQRFAREAAYLEGALAGKSWLVGDGATLADFAAGAGLTHAAAMGLPLEDFPNIRAWNDRVQGLEGFKKTEVKM